MIETVLCGLRDRRGCGELFIITLNFPKNLWIYLVLNRFRSSPDSIFDSQRRTGSVRDDANAIHAKQRHTTVLLVVGFLSDRSERALGELCTKFANRILEELALEPGKYEVSDCFRCLKNDVSGETIAHHHFCGILEKIVSFYVPPEVESTPFEQFK